MTVIISNKHFLDARIEEFVYEELDRKAPSRMNNPELLGQYMIDAGNEFGPGTAYGKKENTDIGFFNNIKLYFLSSSR